MCNPPQSDWLTTPRHRSPIHRPVQAALEVLEGLVDQPVLEDLLPRSFLAARLLPADLEGPLLPADLEGPLLQPILALLVRRRLRYRPSAPKASSRFLQLASRCCWPAWPTRPSHCN